MNLSFNVPVPAACSFAPFNRSFYVTFRKLHFTISSLFHFVHFTSLPAYRSYIQRRHEHPAAKAASSFHSQTLPIGIPGFEAEVYLINGSCFSFVKTEEGWDIQVINDEGFNIAKLVMRLSSPSTFEEFVNLLLTESNMQPGMN